MHPEELRMKLILEWSRKIRENQAAIKIQSNYRRFIARKKFVALVYKKYIAQVTKPVIYIQKVWKKYKTICSTKLYAFKLKISEICKKSAKNIAAWYKGIIMQRNVKYYFLVKLIWRPISDACIKIQSVFKAHSTRKLFKKILDYERRYKSVKWTGPGSDVAIIGDMTDPPWIAKLRMDYCKLRHIFVKYFAKLKSGIYYYNFVVDGEIRVADRQPVFNHMGIECNIFEVSEQPKVQPIMNIPRAFSKDYTVGDAGWNNLRRVCSESSMDLLKSQPAFQPGDIEGSSAEYEILAALKNKDLPEDKSFKEFDQNPAEELKAHTKTDPNAISDPELLNRPFGFKDIKESGNEIMNEAILIRDLEELGSGSQPKKKKKRPDLWDKEIRMEKPQQNEEIKKPEEVKTIEIAKEQKIDDDKYAGGRADIDFNMAYDYENYYG